MEREHAQVLGRHDPVDIALLNHGGAVDAQDQIEQAARIQTRRVAIGIEDDATLHGGIENVVEMQLPRELIDHLGE